MPALGLSRSLEIPRSASADSLGPASIVIRGARLPAFHVSGLVETPSGAPQRFAPVYLDRGDSSSASPLTIAETASDDTGRFAFAEVPAGAYRIRTDTSPSRPGGIGNAPTEIVWGFTPVVVTSDMTDVKVISRPGCLAPRRSPARRRPAWRRASGCCSSSMRLRGRFVPPVLAIDGYLITRGLVPDR